jgi:enoyl-CoA hydratase/carnithine racemase
MSETSRAVLTDRQGAVGIVTINRPDKRNALDALTHEALLDTLDELRADHAVRVVVLTGAGKAFVSGVDINEFVGKTPVDMLRRMLEHPTAIEAADAYQRLVPRFRQRAGDGL